MQVLCWQAADLKHDSAKTFCYFGAACDVAAPNPSFLDNGKIGAGAAMALLSRSRSRATVQFGAAAVMFEGPVERHCTILLQC